MDMERQQRMEAALSVVAREMPALAAGPLKDALQVLRDEMPPMISDARSRAARLQRCEKQRAAQQYRLAGKVYDPP